MREYKVIARDNGEYALVRSDDGSAWWQVVASNDIHTVLLAISGEETQRRLEEAPVIFTPIVCVQVKDGKVVDIDVDWADSFNDATETTDANVEVASEFLDLSWVKDNIDEAFAHCIKVRYKER